MAHRTLAYGHGCDWRKASVRKIKKNKMVKASRRRNRK